MKLAIFLKTFKISSDLVIFVLQSLQSQLMLKTIKMVRNGQNSQIFIAHKPIWGYCSVSGNERLLLFLEAV